MRRRLVDLLLDLLLAHLVASYGVLICVTAAFGSARAELLLLTPVWAPVAVWDVTFGRSPPAWGTLALVDGSYAACFAATVAWRRLARRGSLRARRRRMGLCSECGYDLTGNRSGTCPECGVHVNPKARLILRRSR
jgi:hypothetical protein